MSQTDAWTGKPQSGKKNEQDIKALVKSRPKIQDRYSDEKTEQDFIKKLSLRDTKIWVRVIRVRSNRSSAFREDMTCRHCDSGENESQQNLEKCKGVLA